MKTNMKKAQSVIKNKILTWQNAVLLYGVCGPAMNVNAASATSNSTSGVSSTVSGQATADAKWNAMINFILPWIARLGGVVLLIGAIEFGLAFKNDDAEAKTKGMRTAIAGCIVIAIGYASNTFLI